jgi:hypothetical protein
MDNWRRRQSFALMARVAMAAAICVGLTPMLPREARIVMANGNSQRIDAARQRRVLCRLIIDMMRSIHGAYAPPTESFGGRLETFFIGLCVALGDIEERPFSVSKIAAFMRMPRSTVMRRLDQLQRWHLIDRRGHRYFVKETALNSLMGMRSYRHVRQLLDKAGEELAILDSLPDCGSAWRSGTE